MINGMSQHLLTMFCSVSNLFLSNCSCAYFITLCGEKRKIYLSVVATKQTAEDLAHAAGTDAQGCITLHATCIPEGAATVEVVITDAQYVAAEYVRLKTDRAWLVLAWEAWLVLAWEAWLALAWEAWLVLVWEAWLVLA
jgi:hypothetical protein